MRLKLNKNAIFYLSLLMYNLKSELKTGIFVSKQKKFAIKIEDFKAFG